MCVVITEVSLKMPPRSFPPVGVWGGWGPQLCSRWEQGGGEPTRGSVPRSFTHSQAPKLMARLKKLWFKEEGRLPVSLSWNLQLVGLALVLEDCCSWLRHGSFPVPRGCSKLTSRRQVRLFYKQKLGVLSVWRYCLQAPPRLCWQKQISINKALEHRRGMKLITSWLSASCTFP